MTAALLESQVGSEPTLSIQDLSLEAIGPDDGRTRLVYDLSLTVPLRSIVGLVGESGSGKTLTALAVLGLLPASVARIGGSVRVSGLEVTTLSARGFSQLRARKIGYVPQDPLSSLNPVLRIGEQITESDRLYGPQSRHMLGLVTAREILRGYGLARKRGFWIDRATQILTEALVPEPRMRALQYPHELSGGMRQRVLIGSALALRPSLVIADEPTTALDASLERGILDLLQSRVRNAGSSLLLITHDLNVVSWYCDYAYVMYRGRVVESGPVKELFSAARHPYTRALLSAVPGEVRPEAARQRPLAEAGGQLPPGCQYAARCPHHQPDCDAGMPPLEREGNCELRCLHPYSARNEGDEGIESIHNDGEGTIETIEYSG